MMETFEEKKKRVAEYHLTSDLFAGKVFADLKASQELCRILLQNDKLVLSSVKTQYVIRNLKKHSVELDILAEDVERVRFFKIEEEGVTIMCEITDRIRREGKIEGKIEAILELLEDLGKVPERLIELIGRETNPELLSKWHKCAAKATSLAEFEAGMNV